MGRRTFSREFKMKVAREALSGEKRLSQVCREHDLCQTVVSKWKKQYRIFGELAWPKLNGDAGAEPAQSARPAEPDAEVRVTELEAALGRAHLEIELLQRALQKGGSPLVRNGR
jgi:transposase-like protein